MTLFKQSLVILLSISSVFIVVYTQLSGYIMPILAFLILASVLYIIIKRRNKKNEDIFIGSYIEFYAVTVGILLMLFLTNGFSSNLFFLVYFLLFGISFMFKPFTVFIFMIGLLALFIPQALEGDMFLNSVRLGSIVLLSPISFFFGNEFRRREKLQEEVRRETSKILKSAESLTNEKEALKTDTRDVAEEIIQSTQRLERDAENA